MKIYEKKALIKFMLIYMISTFVLFFVVAILYFFEQRHIILRELQDEMTAYVSMSRDGNEIEKFEEFSLDVQPARRHQYPRFYEDKNSFVSVSCASKYYPDQVFVVTADKNIIEKRQNELVIKVIFLMSIGFFAFLAVSYYLARLSIRPITQAGKTIDTVIEDILHDLNAPMTAIAMNCEGLLPSMSDNKSIKKVERIESSNKTIRFLYNNLQLLLDRPIDLKHESIDVDKLLLARVDFFKELHPDAVFNLSLTPMSFIGDIHAFERVIDNILSNAIKYSQPTPHIHIAGSNATIIIEDNGIGIENCSKIFERHYREIQGSQCASGLGLGLSIVKKLCDQMGIAIELESLQGKGSRFILHC